MFHDVFGFLTSFVFAKHSVLSPHSCAIFPFTKVQWGQASDTAKSGEDLAPGDGTLEAERKKKNCCLGGDFMNNKKRESGYIKSCFLWCFCLFLFPLFFYQERS